MVKAGKGPKMTTKLKRVRANLLKAAKELGKISK